ncbi:hypothetical protein KM043_009635 [Ampulex compressa]|nr:hypothetical protein KM043_009635 [Ampulex compressa]
MDSRSPEVPVYNTFFSSGLEHDRVSEEMGGEAEARGTLVSLESLEHREIEADWRDEEGVGNSVVVREDANR